MPVGSCSNRFSSKAPLSTAESSTPHPPPSFRTDTPYFRLIVTMASLTIRNLTIHPLELVAVERFEADRVPSSGSALGSITGAVTGLFNTTTAADAPSPRVAARGQPRHKDDVSVHVKPFGVHQSDVRSADPGREVIRLTFKTDKHRYQTDVPNPTAQSAEMRKLDAGPHELTAVYVPSGAFLAVFSSARLNSWMAELHSEWPMPMLSIPGTHNSPTCYTALPSVRCQAVGVNAQLLNGVRFLDIRVSCDPANDKLSLVHSVFPISLTGTKYFGDMLDTIYAFLDENLSEAVLMSIKREGTGRGTDADLAKHLKNSYIDKKRDRWYTEPKAPTLGRARGRIVVIRRFDLPPAMKSEWDGRGWGIDAYQWPDNCEDAKTGGGHFCVQDFYEVSATQNIQKKIEYARGQLERAATEMFLTSTMSGFKAETPPPPFFVNFLSASNFFNASCWPDKIAGKVNPAVIEYLCIRHGEDGKGPKKLHVGLAGTGIVVADWVGANDDWDLVRCIVGMNARLQLKQ